MREEVVKIGCIFILQGIPKTDITEQKEGNNGEDFEE